MSTESTLMKIHVFPSEESYNTNQGSVGEDDLSLVPVKLIRSEGSRGSLAGYEDATTISGGGTINDQSNDTINAVNGGTLTISNGASGKAWTKVVSISSASTRVSLGTKWKWYGGVAPDITANSALVLHWCSTFGIASLVVSG